MPNMYRKRTNAQLQPPPPHILKLVAAAGDHPTLARLIANGFDNLLDLFPWFMVPEEAEGICSIWQRAQRYNCSASPDH
jgi:hypothetical protein